MKQVGIHPGQMTVYELAYHGIRQHLPEYEGGIRNNGIRKIGKHRD